MHTHMSDRSNLSEEKIYWLTLEEEMRFIMEESHECECEVADHTWSMVKMYKEMNTGAQVIPLSLYSSRDPSLWNGTTDIGEGLPSSLKSLWRCRVF